MLITLWAQNQPMELCGNPESRMVSVTTPQSFDVLGDQPSQDSTEVSQTSKPAPLPAVSMGQATQTVSLPKEISVHNPVTPPCQFSL